jgi:hypothetical protein
MKKFTLGLALAGLSLGMLSVAVADEDAPTMNVDGDIAIVLCPAGTPEKPRIEFSNETIVQDNCAQAIETVLDICATTTDPGYCNYTRDSVGGYLVSVYNIPSRAK